MSSRIIKVALSVLGLISIAAFLFSVNPGEFWNSLKMVKFSLIGMVFLFTIANIFLKAMRWKIIVEHIGGERISYLFSFLSIIAGVAGGSIIPGKMEVAKPLLLKDQTGMSLTQSIPLLLAERMLDFVVIASLLFLTALLLPTQKIFNASSLELVVIAALAMMIIFFIASDYLFPVVKFVLAKIPLPEKVKRKALDFEHHFLRTASLLKQKKIGFLVLLLSVLAILLEILRLQMILQSLGVDSTLLITIFAFAVAVVAGIISLIPGGIGVTEFSYTGILLFLIPSASSAAVKSSVLLNRFFAYYLLIIIGSIILLFHFKNFKKSLRKEQPNTVFGDKNGGDMVK